MSHLKDTAQTAHCWSCSQQPHYRRCLINCLLFNNPHLTGPPSRGFRHRILIIIYQHNITFKSTKSCLLKICYTSLLIPREFTLSHVGRQELSKLDGHLCHSECYAGKQIAGEKRSGGCEHICQSAAGTRRQWWDTSVDRTGL